MTRAVEKEYKAWHVVVETITALLAGGGIALLIVWLAETALWKLIE